MSERPEGNVGAAASVPLPRDTTPPAAPQGVFVTAPSASRAESGIDVRWRNLTDAGSPIDAAHYRVLDADGNVVVQTRSVSGPNVETISELDAPRAGGLHVLRLWLSDAEGNVGAPVSVPLSYSCARSDVDAGRSLTSAVGRRGRGSVTVEQGSGTVLRGRLLRDDRAGVSGASICVFTRVATDSERRFAGIAVTDGLGRYRFAISAGPSRELTAAYRSGHREVSSGVRVVTRVRPVFKVPQRTVKNNGLAQYVMRYRFTRTTTRPPT